MMSLGKTCENKLVEQILSLPPVLKEDLLKISEKKFKLKILKDTVARVEKKIYKKLNAYLPSIIESEIMHNLRQNRTPYSIDLPEYKDMDSFVVELGKHIADMVTPQLHHELRMREIDRREERYEEGEEDEDSENVPSDYDYPDEDFE